MHTPTVASVDDATMDLRQPANQTPRANWVDRLRDTRLHGGVVLAILVGLGLLVLAYADGRGSAWLRYAYFAGFSVAVVGLIAALWAADRRRWEIRLTEMHTEVLAAVARHASQAAEAQRAAGWDRDTIRQVLDEVAREQVRHTSAVLTIAAASNGTTAAVDNLRDGLGAWARQCEQLAANQAQMTRTLEQVVERLDRIDKADARRRAHRNPRRRDRVAVAGADDSNVTRMPDSKAFELGRQVERRRWERRNGSEN